MTDRNLALFGGVPVRSRPWPRWPQATEATVKAVRDVLGSTRWTVSGPYDGRACYERRFAEAFARFHGVAHCTPTASGTAALTIALQAVGVGRGDEVLVPGLTWVACASAVANLGAVPRLVDLDPKTLAMCPDRARAMVSSRTVAVLLVHPYCTVADLDAFPELARQHGLALIEDCAQAHGASWRGRPVGTFGSAGCFSMQQAKLLTCGEGGAVITNDNDLYARLEQLRADGRMFGTEPRRGALELVEVAAVQGRNLCLSELQAAVLLCGLDQLPGQNETRAKRAQQFEFALADCEGVSPLANDPRVTMRTFYNFVLQLVPATFADNTVDAISAALSAELGTQVSPLYTPLNRNPLYCPTKTARGDLSERELARLDPTQFELSVAEEARRTCLTLTHPTLSADERGIDDIIEAIDKVRRYAGRLRRYPQEPSCQAF